MMNKFFFKLFKIYEGEGVKVLTFAIAGILYQTGFSIGAVASDSLFLTHIGADKLSYIYFILPAIMIFTTPIMSFFTEKIGASRFQIVVSLLLAGGGVALFFCVSAAEAAGESAVWLYYVIKLYSSLWHIAGFTIFWNFVDSYFDILSAKRLFPVLSGATAIGATIGGGLVTLFMRCEWSVGSLFLVWSAVSAAAMLPVWRAIESFHSIKGEEEEEPSFREQLRRLSDAYKNTNYVMFITLTAFIAMLMTNICEFQYMQIFEERHSDAVSLANLFGRLFMIVNVFNMFATFFLFNRLIVILGVRNAALIQPVVYLVSFMAYIAFFGQANPMYFAAVLGFFALQGTQSAIDENNWNLLLNPIPANVKTSIRSISEGVVDPLGGALAGLLLFVMNQRLLLSHLHISVFGAGLSLVLLAVALCLRHYYVSAMIHNLRADWLDFSRSESDIFSGMSQEEKDELVRIARMESMEEIAAACRILWLNDRILAVKTILEILDRCEEQDRGRALEVLAEMLGERDNEIVRIVISWLLSHGEKAGSSIVRELGRHHLIQGEFVLRMLDSLDPNDRAAAATVLWNSWDIENAHHAMWTALILVKGNEEEREAGIRAIGGAGLSQYANFLVPFLEDPSPQVRKAAKLSICRVVDEDSTSLLPIILEMIGRGDGEIRSLGFSALSRIGDSNCIPSLLARADDFSPFERRQINQVIIGFGLRSVPSIVSVVRNAYYPYSGRSIAARALARLAFPQLQALMPALISEEILRAYQILFYRAALEEVKTPSPGFKVLSRFYRDEHASTLEFILEILALGGQIPNHEMIASSLRSKSAKTRGNAIETLEQAVNRDSFKLLMPLVDGRPVEDKIHFYFRCFKAESLSSSQVVNAAWGSQMDLERAAAAQAKWDLTQEDEEEDEAFKDMFKTVVLDQIAGGIGEAPDLVKKTVFSILQREAGKTVQDNPIEKIALFAESELFGKISTRDLAILAAGSSLAEFEKDECIFRKGEPPNGLYYIKNGEAVIRGGDGEEILSKGHTFGEKFLFGAKERISDAYSNSMTCYFWKRDFLVYCVQTYPRIAMGFMEREAGN
ncbi:MAG: cyclic nucleotide-binding domain-containing protein [Candidatus Omnitrophota bacterium]